MARPAAAGQVRLRRRGRPARAWRWTRWCARASSSPAPRCAARCSRPACTCTPTPRSRTRCSCTASTSAATPSCAARSSTRTCASPPGAQIGVDPDADRERFTVSAGGVVVIPKGADGRGVRVALLTREYPPDVYGGAGVHVEYLARELRRLDRGRRPRLGRRPRAGAIGHEAWDALDGAGAELAALRAMSIDLTMAAGDGAPTLVHSHTWYAKFGGHLAKLVHDIPHVVDRALARAAAPVEGRAARRRLRAVVVLRAHGGGGGRRDRRRLGGDARRPARRLPGDRPRARRRYLQRDRHRRVRARPRHRRARAPRHRPRRAVDRLRRAHHAPEGRRAPARGACATSTPSAQLVLCAGAPDTPEIGAEVARRVERAAGASAAT